MGSFYDSFDLIVLFCGHLPYLSVVEAVRVEVGGASTSAMIRIQEMHRGSCSLQSKCQEQTELKLCSRVFLMSCRPADDESIGTNPQYFVRTCASASSCSVWCWRDAESLRDPGQPGCGCASQENGQPVMRNGEIEEGGHRIIVVVFCAAVEAEVRYVSRSRNGRQILVDRE